MSKKGLTAIEVMIVIAIIAIIASIAIPALTRAKQQQGTTSATPGQGGQKDAPKQTIPAYEIDLAKLELPAERTALPDTVGIFFCLDCSGSMANAVGGKKKIDISKEAMQRVCTQIADYVNAHPEKKVSVGLASFSATAKLVQPLQPFDPAKLQRAIQSMQPGGATAIGDAMLLGLAELLKSSTENKAILVMSDGENNRGTPPDQVVQAIKKGANNKQIATGDVEVFLVAFDAQAKMFNTVKDAGAVVLESRDQKSLEGILSSLVEKVLLEAP